MSTPSKDSAPVRIRMRYRCRKCQRCASGKTQLTPEQAARPRVVNCINCGPTMHDPAPEAAPRKAPESCSLGMIKLQRRKP